MEGRRGVRHGRRALRRIRQAETRIDEPRARLASAIDTVAVAAGSELVGHSICRKSTIVSAGIVERGHLAVSVPPGLVAAPLRRACA
ncbi:MAG: hypothetical protein QOE41_675 [Mycobacterium sp.]|nr:hypothetical protein [Mycobacterium sp.]